MLAAYLTWKQLLAILQYAPLLTRRKPDQAEAVIGHPTLRDLIVRASAGRHGVITSDRVIFFIIY